MRIGIIKNPTKNEEELILGEVPAIDVSEADSDDRYLAIPGDCLPIIKAGFPDLELIALTLD